MSGHLVYVSHATLEETASVAGKTAGNYQTGKDEYFNQFAALHGGGETSMGSAPSGAWTDVNATRDLADVVHHVGQRTDSSIEDSLRMQNANKECVGISGECMSRVGSALRSALP